MDPQQRLLLEVAWEALEDAGIAPDGLAGTPHRRLRRHQRRATTARLQSRDLAGGRRATPAPATRCSIAANRLSYVLDLRGPSLAVDTACSSSLVAVHLPARACARGECDLALAGGVNLILDPELTVDLRQRRHAGRATAAARPSTPRADGYVRGEGVRRGGAQARWPTRARDGDRVLRRDRAARRSTRTAAATA